MQKNILVVGQGLAGSLLAFFLHEQGVQVRIMDAGKSENCSSVSSGIINPITGRRFVKSWMIDALLPVAVNTYRRLEATLQIPLLREIPIVRTLHGIRDENQWLMQSGKPGYDRFMSESPPAIDYSSCLQSTHSFALVNGGYRVNASALISGMRSWFEQQNFLRRVHFDHRQLTCQGNHYRYGEEDFDAIVFCEGWKVRNNPFFNALPFQPFKGEVFTCHISEFPQDAILKFKKFFVPLGNEEFWVGSTNQWSFNDESADPAKVAELEDFLINHLSIPYKITDKKTGIRPATKFRRPFVGEHPNHPGMYILNGLGTKGFSLGPYWAEHLTNCIIEGHQPQIETSLHFHEILAGEEKNRQ